MEGTTDDSPYSPDAVTLRGKLLLASPTLDDGNFACSVVLIVRHDADGALGLVLNRPLGLTVDEAAGDQVQAAKGCNLMLYQGGPCSGPLLAIHDRYVASPQADYAAAADDDDAEPLAEPVFPGVWFSANGGAIAGLMGRTAAQDDVQVKFVVGHAGWSAGQLEAELAEGSWQVADPRPQDVFGIAHGHGQRPRLPARSIHLATLLAEAAELYRQAKGRSGTGVDVASAVADGLRQWVRLTTRVRLGELIDARLIPDEPGLN